MIRTIALLVLALASHVLAEVRVTAAPAKLAGDENTRLSSPLWAPDGATIAVTSPDYTGIWLMRPDGSDLRQINAERGAGFGMQWSPDSRALVARVSRQEGHRMQHALRVFDLPQQRDSLLSTFRVGPVSLPEWTPDGGQVLAFVDGHLLYLETGLLPVSLLRPSPRPLCLLDLDRPLLLNAAAAEPVAIPALAGKHLFNLVHSADGSRIAFQTLGGPLCVMQSDGTGLIELGTGEWPSFSPDGRYLAYMITEDDGHVITGSDLYAIAVDGAGKVNLTATSGRSEMHPSWSPLGDAILFDVCETGEVWKLPVAITEP
ncbi:MAG TPA: hypothetical protein PLN61_15740 [bacterium]|nr:hypothetical protein [bacterium]HQI50102.1 hypothetical protein [bacterium]HQJ66038.1 hypothetical protein [bacterium]